MEQRTIPVVKTAHYSLGGNKESKRLIVAFHGYGQLSRFFSRKFAQLEKDYLIAIPEGLNYFYTDGFAGRVGASWMTKENREEEILDYLGYFKALLAQLTNEFGEFNEVVLLGFSQGTATASRCLANGEVNVSKLILWSGLPANEIHADKLKDLSENVEIVFVQGESDELRPEEHYEAEMKKFSNAGVKYSEHWYKGGHAIDASFLAKLMA